MSLQIAGVSSGPPQVPGPIRALVLDDSAFDRARLRRFGDRIDLPIEFAEEESVAGLARTLDRQAFDLVMIDYAMPDSNGLQALDLLRAHPMNHGAAAIMVSGRADTQVAVSAMKRGCIDFVSKDDMSAERLRAIILAVMAAPERRMRTISPTPDRSGDMSTLLRAALTPELLREALHAPVQEEMRRAAQRQAFWSGSDASPEFLRFLADFRDDEGGDFRFH